MKKRILFGFLGIIFVLFFTFYRNIIFDSFIFILFAGILLFETFQYSPKATFGLQVVSLLSLLLFSLLNSIELGWLINPCSTVAHNILQTFSLGGSQAAMLSLAFFFFASIAYSIFFTKKENFDSHIYALSRSMLVLFYLFFVLHTILKVKYADYYQARICTAYSPITKAGLPYFMLFAWCATWSYDTFAFLFGSKFGTRKIGLDASPNKTWLGLFSGILFTSVLPYLLVSFALSWSQNTATIRFFSENAVSLILLSVIMALAAQFGDYFSSILKRAAARKDSSNLFPGHGGFFDRLDSSGFVFLVLYIFLMFQEFF